MPKGTLKVHSENILPIIKKWLYTDKDIFLRELASNACDAMSKLKKLRNQEKISFNDEELRIDIKINKEANTLEVMDTGLGMTGKEVEKYIAQLAVSGAEEFIKKYQKEGSVHDEIIGHFGLGFYSSFMVSDQVEIDTCSFQEHAKPIHWSCTGSSDYTLDAGKRTQRGTTVTLHISSDAKDFLEEHYLRTILLKYCRFLPYPIYLNGQHLNTTSPLWIQPTSTCTDKDYLEFYRTLYPFSPDPIFWIHLNVDYPFRLQGILYFPKLTRRLDSDDSFIHLYCNRVFVSDHIKELIPDHLTILRGIIDSPDLPLNVSRSNLQMNRIVKQFSSYLSKKFAEACLFQYKNKRQFFIENWPNTIEILVKLGILQTDKFYEQAKECLIWKNSNDEWITIEQYLERHTEKKIFYYNDSSRHPHFVDMYKNKGIEIIFSSCYLDSFIMNYLEKPHPGVVFQRLDGTIDESILDKTREKTLLDNSGKTQASHLEDFFRSQLKAENVEIKATSLSHDNLFGFVSIPEKDRRMRSCLALSEMQDQSKIEGQTFVINTNNALIQSIPKIRDVKLASNLVNYLYQLTLLSQKESELADCPHFLQHSSEILESLASLVVSK